MAKEKERRTAHILYVEQGKTAREIADLIGVAEKTIGEWVSKGAWKEERTARQASPVKRADNIKLIITNLSEDRLSLDRRIKAAEAEGKSGMLPDLREEVSRIDDAVSKWNKTLENIESENRISLSTYLNVMDQIFQAIRQYDVKLFMSTVEFQESHIHKISRTLG
jgi:predicted transcriptional regulator